MGIESQNIGQETMGTDSEEGGLNIEDGNTFTTSESDSGAEITFGDSELNREGSFETTELSLENQEGNDSQIDELKDLYERLGDETDVIKGMEEDKEKLANVRSQLGIQDVDSNSHSDGEMDLDELSSLEKEIDEVEKKYLNSPEQGIKRVEKRDGIDKYEYEALFKKFREAIDEAKERYIEETTEFIAKKYEKDFKEAANGEEAEKLFRAKYPIFLRRSLESVDPDTGEFTETTHVTFHFTTLEKEGGDDIIYFDKIDIKNKSAFFNEKDTYGDEGK